MEASPPWNNRSVIVLSDGQFCFKLVMLFKKQNFKKCFFSHPLVQLRATCYGSQGKDCFLFLSFSVFLSTSTSRSKTYRYQMPRTCVPHALGRACSCDTFCFSLQPNGLFFFSIQLARGRSLIYTRDLNLLPAYFKDHSNALVTNSKPGALVCHLLQFL